MSPRNRFNPSCSKNYPIIGFQCFLYGSPKGFPHSHPVAKLLCIFDHAAQTILQLNLPTSCIHLGARLERLGPTLKNPKELVVQMGQKYVEAFFVHAPCVLKRTRCLKIGQFDHGILVADDSSYFHQFAFTHTHIYMYTHTVVAQQLCVERRPVFRTYGAKELRK